METAPVKTKKRTIIIRHVITPFFLGSNLNINSYAKPENAFDRIVYREKTQQPIHKAGIDHGKKFQYMGRL